MLPRFDALLIDMDGTRVDSRALGVAPDRCIVIEDADAGIAAGMRVLDIGPAGVPGANVIRARGLGEVCVVHAAEGLGLLVADASSAASKTRADGMHR